MATATRFFFPVRHAGGEEFWGVAFMRFIAVCGYSEKLFLSGDSDRLALIRKEPDSCPATSGPGSVNVASLAVGTFSRGVQAVALRFAQGAFREKELKSRQLFGPLRYPVSGDGEWILARHAGRGAWVVECPAGTRYSARA